MTPTEQLLRDALEEVEGCFSAAIVEGLIEAVAETADEHLKDLFQRRLMHAHATAIDALLATSQQAEGEPVVCLNHPDDHRDLVVTAQEVTCIACGDSWPRTPLAAPLPAQQEAAGATEVARMMLENGYLSGHMKSPEAAHDLLKQFNDAVGSPISATDHEEILADHRRLVRELDVLLNGSEGAAKQASLCDIVAQVKHEGIMLASASLPSPAPQAGEPISVQEALKQVLQEMRDMSPQELRKALDECAGGELAKALACKPLDNSDTGRK